MARPVPTQPGDVLILQTERGVKIHAVGRVATAGQQDFHAQATPLYIVDHAEALAAARTLAMPGRRMFLLRIDSDEWSELAS
jgi:hypothetical protein